MMVETAGPGSLDRVNSTTSRVTSTTASARLIQRSTLEGLPFAYWPYWKIPSRQL